MTNIEAVEVIKNFMNTLIDEEEETIVEIALWNALSLAIQSLQEN